MARSETGKGTDFIVQMPEVVAKYRTPADIAKAKAKRNFARLDATRYAILRMDSVSAPHMAVCPLLLLRPAAPGCEDRVQTRAGSPIPALSSSSRRTSAMAATITMMR